jgi:penicillin-binding protein 1A
MKKVTGGTLPAKLWREVMLIAHEGLSPLPLPGTEPAGGPVVMGMGSDLGFDGEPGPLPGGQPQR